MVEIRTFYFVVKVIFANVQLKNESDSVLNAISVWFYVISKHVPDLERQKSIMKIENLLASVAIAGGAFLLVALLFSRFQYRVVKPLIDRVFLGLEQAADAFFGTLRGYETTFSVLLDGVVGAVGRNDRTQRAGLRC